jgi:hypothetical protein
MPVAEPSCLEGMSPLKDRLGLVVPSSDSALVIVGEYLVMGDGQLDAKEKPVRVK